MIATSRRRTIVVGLLIGIFLLLWWYTRQPAPDWEFSCGGEKPVVAVSADGRLLAVGASTEGPGKETPGGTRPSLSGLIQVWNIAERKLLASRETDEAIQSLAFTSDGSHIFAATNDMFRDDYPEMRLPDDHGSLLTWNFHGQERPIEVALPDSVRSAALSPDDKYVAAILGGDKGVEEMRLKPKLCVASFDALLKGVLEPVDLPPTVTTAVLGHRAAFIRNNRLVVVVGDAKLNTSPLEIWEIDGRKRVARTSIGVPSPIDIAVAPNGKVITRLDEYGVGITDLQTMEESIQPHNQEWPIKRQSTLRYHPNGKLFAVAGAWKSLFPHRQKGGIVLYDLPNWEVAGLIRLSDWDTAILSIAFTPNGESLFTASENGSIRLWSMKDFGLTTIDKN